MASSAGTGGRWGVVAMAMAVGLLAACGRIDYDPRADDADPRQRADGASGASCSPWQAGFSFTAPERLDALNSAGVDFEPSITPDGLTLYFASERAGGVGSTDIYMATRPSLDSSFAGPPVLVGDLSTAGTETKVVLSHDGLTVILAATWSGGVGQSDLWTGTRAAVGSPFGGFSLVQGTNTAADEYDPHLSVDGLRLHWETYDSPWGAWGDGEIVMATRSSPTGAFSAPTLIPGFVPMTSDEGNVTLSGDELVLVYTSNSAGSSDVWYATRTATDQPFGPAALLAELNTPDEEAQTALGADGCEIVFAATRAGGAGGEDLYHARYVAPR